MQQGFMVNNLIQPRDREIGVSTKVEQFSGPLPPPAILEQYNNVVPGAAERILKMAEEQSNHRRSLEQKVISSDVDNARLGMVFGFIIGLVAILAGVYIVIIDKNNQGYFLSLGAIVALVGVFVYGRKKKEQRLEEKKNGR
jgi:uncharacterized membrane protein